MGVKLGHWPKKRKRADGVWRAGNKNIYTLDFKK
jgi:hypothetical protein